MFKNMEYEKIKKRVFDGLIGFAMIIFYYLSSYFAEIPLNLFNVNINEMNYIIKAIYLITFQVAILLVVILVYRKELLIQWNDFKQNKNIYFKKYFKFWFLILGGMMLSNYIIINLNGGEIANNEQGIREMFAKNPFYVYIASVLIAPLMEELIFRFSLRKIINQKWIFIVFSGLIFGAAHIIGQVETWVDYLYIIPYAIPGFVFSYLLVKTDNIFSSVSMHIFHNGILMALQFFVLFFGAN